MANENMANNFFALMQGQDNTGDHTASSMVKDTAYDTDLPIDPKTDNGEELDLVEDAWKKRPLEDKKQEDTVSRRTHHTGGSIVVTTNGHMNPLLAPTKEEKPRQRNFGLTDSQFENFLEAAVAFGHVRVGKGGKQEPNGSSFLQAMIDAEIWNLIIPGEAHNG